MIRLISLLFVFTFVSSVQAEDRMVPAHAVASVVTSNMDGDYFRYRALLANVDGGADLYIFTDRGEGMELASYTPGIVWRGGMYGQEPWLEVAANKSLQVISENDSIGRNRWRQTLTVAFRGGKFVVAGYTYAYRDTLDPDASGECDVNLLSGKGFNSGKPFKTGLKVMSVEAWTMDTQPKECIN